MRAGRPIRLGVTLALLTAMLTRIRAVDPPPAWQPLVVHRAESPPDIDGRPDEPCWTEADRRPLRHYAGGELEVAGSAAISYDRDNLYAALWLDEPTPDKITSAVEPRGLWDGEVIEWFICPSDDGMDYVQLAWNPAGRQFSAKCRATGGGAFTSDTNWHATWKTASAVSGTGWTTEAALPFAELGLTAPDDGAVWRINLNRHRVAGGGKPQWSALSPTGTGGFHMIDRFEDVSFGTIVGAATRTRGDGPLQALIGCWGPRFGYSAVFAPHLQLDRALGRDNVHIRIRPPHSSAMTNWPRRAGELGQYHLVVLAGVPVAAFSDKQLAHLRQYVLDGGGLILMGSMSGWKHEPSDGWWKSPLADLMPLEPTPSGPVEVRDVHPSDRNHPLWRGLPATPGDLVAFVRKTRPAADATVIATTDGAPLIAERKAGKGIVVQVTGHYGHKATGIPVPSFGRDFFMSAYYPLFWDNLVRHVTGKPVLNAAGPPQPKALTRVRCDVIRDNHGDLFAPGSTLRLKPDFTAPEDAYPCEAIATIEDAAGRTTPAGRHALADAAGELLVELPCLDRGHYSLHLDVRKGAEQVGSKTAPFSVALPLPPRDEFSFSVLVPGDYLGEPDMKRIAQTVRSAGFTSVFWLGGHIYGSYRGMYRTWNRSRFVSRMQEAGLRVSPVWYPALLCPLQADGLNRHFGLKTGRPGPVSRRTVPKPAFPGKDFLPYAHFWLETLTDTLYGRMPLTNSYYAHDEIVGARFAGAETDRFKQAFETATGIPAASIESTPRATYRFMDYKLGTVTDYVWLNRAVGEAHAPHLALECTISPMSLGSHTSAVVDILGTTSALGSAAPDVYHYGEQKLYVKSLGNMAIIWSATEFGRLSQPSFMGGQLNNAYYEAFPEQVFAALSGGARKFEVFSYGTTSFETNGREDTRFVDIARRTTAEAGRIGRTLNHYRRTRARVAMLYPQTAHLWLSMGQAFNDDYLELVGTSEQYIGLGGAVRAQYDLLRRAVGHVDILFDEQIQRGDLSNYDVCVVGYARQVEARTLRTLRRFAESGGTLLVSTDSARLDESNEPTNLLYGAMPAAVGPERAVSADYTDTRMPNLVPFSRGNALEPKPEAEVLFTFPDQQPACVRGALGRGEAILLGMPLASLRAEVNHAKRTLVAYVLNKRARLISRPDDDEFSAVTFLPERGENRVFLAVNHRKHAASTRVIACGDEEEATHTLADIVTGERVAFTVDDGQLSFGVDCPARWGRALALLPRAPSAIEVSASAPVGIGGKLMIAVRLLGTDGQLVRSTLPFDLVVKDPAGNVRDDLSGVRVAERGVFASAMRWPVNAAKGTWTVAVAEAIGGGADQAQWESP